MRFQLRKSDLKSKSPIISFSVCIGYDYAIPPNSTKFSNHYLTFEQRLLINSLIFLLSFLPTSPSNWRHCPLWHLCRLFDLHGGRKYYYNPLSTFFTFLSFVVEIASCISVLSGYISVLQSQKSPQERSKEWDRFQFPIVEQRSSRM